jgi:phosphate/sulfate permease
VFGGAGGVVWYEPIKDFPYVTGIIPVVISWFLSPLLAALITLVLFLIIRTFVLRRVNSTKIAFWVLPVLMVLTFFINLFFILVSALHHAQQCCVVPKHRCQHHFVIAHAAWCAAALTCRGPMCA